MNRQKIKHRREDLLPLLARGLTESEIAKSLQISQSTVSRDIEVLKEASRDYVNDIAKSFGYYYQECIEGINQVRRESWVMYLKENAPKIKLEALSLFKECNVSKFNLLADGPTVISIEKMRKKYEKTAKNT